MSRNGWIAIITGLVIACLCISICSGTFLVGMGDKFDLSQTKTMAVGDTGTVPALSHHFAAAKGSTIVQVTAMGPFARNSISAPRANFSARTACVAGVPVDTIVATLNMAGESAGMKKRRSELSIPIIATDAAELGQRAGRG